MTSTIFDDLWEAGYCVSDPSMPNDFLLAEANTVMALHTLVETGLLMSAGPHVIERARRMPNGASLRFVPGSREDLAEAKAAAYYAAAREAMTRAAMADPMRAAYCNEDLPRAAHQLVLNQQMLLAQGATKH